MGKNQKLRKKIVSLQRQIKAHRGKQKNIGEGDAPWLCRGHNSLTLCQTNKIKWQLLLRAAIDQNT
jgi:hypothetical protein